MNWYKKAKKDKKWNVLDTQLLCCGYPENRRKNPYKPNVKNEKTARKARYLGQTEGDEFRSQTAIDDEFFGSMNQEYRSYILKMKNLIKSQDWLGFEKYKQDLSEIFDKVIVEKFIISPAMYGLKF